MIADFRSAVAAAALFAAPLAVGCGGGDSTGTAPPTVGHQTSTQQGRGGGVDHGGSGPAAPALLPANFERKALAGSDPSRVGVVVAPLAGGPIKAFGASKAPHAWSTIKPVIAVAVLKARRAGDLAGGRAPTASERDLISRAIENSDNEAAAQLFGELGSMPQATAAMQMILVEAGDRTTKVNGEVTRPGFSSYGQTEWAPRQAALFYRQLANGCLADGADTRLILADMGAVTPVGGSGWGLPLARFKGVRFKAGWGPERGATGYTALQYGVVGDADSGGYVIGVFAETDGDAAGAYDAVSAVARNAAAALRGRQGPKGPPQC
ncbi:MAG: hypothetical protein ACRDK1_04600 [Solirubrobacterales bacterium]